MPTKLWDLSGPGHIWDDEELVLSALDGAWLRRADSGGSYSAKGAVSASAIFTLPEWKPRALVSMHGAELDAETNDGALGTVRFRVSRDGGATFLFWNGSDWVTPADDTEWNDIESLNEGLPNLTFLPLSGKTLTPRVKLTSFENSTPRFLKLSVHYEATFDFEDDIKLTLKHYIENGLQARIRYREAAETASVQLTVESDFTIAGVESAFNLTKDPQRTTNIFSHRVGTTVHLSATPTAGDILEAILLCTAPVFIAVDEDFQVSHNPAVIIMNPRLEELREMRLGDRKLEPNVATYVAKIRNRPVWNSVTTRVVCQAKREHEALAMAQALARLFQYHRSVTSEANGEALLVTDLVPVEDTTVMGTGVHAKTTSFNVSGRFWLDEPETRRMVEEVGVSAEPMPQGQQPYGGRG
jgi:hypothetical protein